MHRQYCSQEIISPKWNCCVSFLVYLLFPNPHFIHTSAITFAQPSTNIILQNRFVRIDLSVHRYYMLIVVIRISFWLNARVSLFLPVMGVVTHQGPVQNTVLTPLLILTPTWSSMCKLLINKRSDLSYLMWNKKRSCVVWLFWLITSWMLRGQATWSKCTFVV